MDAVGGVPECEVEAQMCGRCLWSRPELFDNS